MVNSHGRIVVEVVAIGPTVVAVIIAVVKGAEEERKCRRRLFSVLYSSVRICMCMCVIDATIIN